MIDGMRSVNLLQLVMRWVWLLSLALVGAALSVAPAGMALLGLSGALAAWLSISAAVGEKRFPSTPWLLGVDLALGVGLIAVTGGWRSPYWSVWVFVGLLAYLHSGPGSGLRASSAGVVLSAILLASLGGAAPGSMLALSVLALGVLLGTILVMTAARPARQAALADASRAAQVGSNPAPAGGLGAEWVLAAAASLGSAADSSQIVERSLELSVAVGAGDGGPCSAAILLSTPAGWTVHGARRLPPGDRQIVLSAPTGAVKQAFDTRAAVVSREPARDPALEKLTALQACAEVVCVPLLRGGEAFGVLLVGWPASAKRDPAALTGLEAVGQLTAGALGNADRIQRAEAEKIRLGEVEEASRRRLARDLHDGPTQAVASLAMRLNYIGRLIERDPSAARAELATAEEMARRATSDMRHMLFTLRPLLLESQGLVPALWQLAKKLRDTQGEQVEVEAELEAADGMGPLQQSVIFYVAEEAINNAVKHAQAEHIWVRLEPQPSGWLLEVKDDGVGFNVGAVDEDYAQRGSLGLVNMRERAALAGGQLRISSQEGSGTRISASIPRGGEADPDA
jgi:signal transduction histidine kinase